MTHQKIKEDRCKVSIDQMHDGRGLARNLFSNGRHKRSENEPRQEEEEDGIAPRHIAPVRFAMVQIPRKLACHDENPSPVDRERKTAYIQLEVFGREESRSNEKENTASENIMDAQEENAPSQNG